MENIRMVSLIAGLKMEGIVKWRGLISQGQLYLVILLHSLSCFAKVLGHFWALSMLKAWSG